MSLSILYIIFYFHLNRFLYLFLYINKVYTKIGTVTTLLNVVIKIDFDAKLILPSYSLQNIIAMVPTGIAEVIIKIPNISSFVTKYFKIKKNIIGITICFKNVYKYNFFSENTSFIGICANDDPINIIASGVVIGPIIDTVSFIINNTFIFVIYIIIAIIDTIIPGLINFLISKDNLLLFDSR